MGSCHGRAGAPIELQALPEAWGEGTKRRQIPDTTALQSPVKERVIPIEAEDIKIESVEEVGMTENTSPDEKENGSNSHCGSSNKFNIFEGVKTPAEVSITSRRTMTKSASPRPKSDGSQSWNGSIEHEGSTGHLSVTSYNLIRTIRSSCRTSKSLLDYSDLMFKDLLKKLELMHTNTRMRLMDDIERREERREEQFTDIGNEIKELKQTVEKQSKLLEIQRLNGQSSRNRFAQTKASSQNVTEKAPPKELSYKWSRAATSMVRRAVSNCAPAQTTKPSRIPVPVPDATIRSMFFYRTKSETVGNIRQRPEQQHQQAAGNSSTVLLKHHCWAGAGAGAGAVRKHQQKQRNDAKGKQINILEHKKGPKLAQYR